MKRVIITADDFGLTESITKGIAESILKGVVTRTSAMMCTGGYEWIKMYSVGIENRIGIHLQLTDGTPLSTPEEIPSLINSENNFPDSWKKLGALKPDEIENEWERQIQAFINLGLTPSHIDTHHNVHKFPVVLSVLIKLAIKYNLNTRPLSFRMKNVLKKNKISNIEYCIEDWCGNDVSPESLIAHLKSAYRPLNDKGVVEIMTHPGYVDDNLEKRSYYLSEREQELKVLCNKKTKELLSKYEFELSIKDTSIIKQYYA